MNRERSAHPFGTRSVKTQHADRPDTPRTSSDHGSDLRSDDGLAPHRHGGACSASIRTERPPAHRRTPQSRVFEVASDWISEHAGAPTQWIGGPGRTRT